MVEIVLFSLKVLAMLVCLMFCVWGVLFNWWIIIRRLKCEGFNIWKKLKEENEQSNSDLLTTLRNPVGVIARLNHHHGWNMPGVTKEISKKEKLTLQDTLKDFEQFKIEQNCQTIDEN